MADPNHPRKFTEEFRRQIVQPYLAGKPRGELMAVFVNLIRGHSSV